MRQSGSRPKVLFLIPTLTAGGSERVIVTLLRYLDRTRFHPSLAVVDTRNAVFLNDVPEEVEFIDLGHTRVRYALPKIIHLIRRRRPDIVFSTLGHMNLALAMAWPFIPRGTYLIARESSIVSLNIQLNDRPEIWQWLYRRFYANLDLVVCQSYAMLDDLVMNFDFPAHRAVVIHNPVDLDRIRELAAEQPTHSSAAVWQRKKPTSASFIAAGRLEEEKGFDLIFRAVALLKDKDIHLTLLGEGPLRPSLERLAKDLLISEQVRFMGFQENPYQWYAQADALILSSRYEGFPNVVIEAMACGTPVIATPAPGGTKEVLAGIPECMIADDVTAEALAVSVRQWMHSDRKPVPEGRVWPYRIAAIIKQYEDLLSKSYGHRK